MERCCGVMYLLASGEWRHDTWPGLWTVIRDRQHQSMVRILALLNELYRLQTELNYVSLHNSPLPPVSHLWYISQGLLTAPCLIEDMWAGCRTFLAPLNIHPIDRFCFVHDAGEEKGTPLRQVKSAGVQASTVGHLSLGQWDSLTCWGSLSG